MRVLIATTGVLAASQVADLCERLIPADADITVMTVIEIPRTFLEEMNEDERRSFLDENDWQTQTAELKALSYLEERGRRAVDPVVASLKAVERSPKVRFEEGADPVEAIIQAAISTEADLIVMGATRRLFTEQAWNSVSARVMERTHCPLLLVPGLRSEDTGEIPRLEMLD